MSLQRFALRAAVACALLVPAHAHAFEGKVSWYGGENGQGRRHVACGERYRPEAILAAHWTLPCGTRVHVTDLATGRSIVVPVRDRGPHPRLHRALDLSQGAARRLGILGRGVIRARIVVVSGAGAGRLHLAGAR
jgi:rare lipoprotein A